MARQTILPLAAMERLLKKSGAPRVSQSAKEALKDALEERAMQIGEQAIRFAKHSGRKTVKASDIKLANR